MIHSIGRTLPPRRLRARNYGEDHENKIHSDEGAAKYGFAGALVPGVAVYAYLARPVLDGFGEEWLEQGAMKARFIRPVYDGEEVIAVGVVTGLDPLTAALELRNAAGDLCAVGEASLGRSAGAVSVADFPWRELPAREERLEATIGAFRVGDVLGSLDLRIDGGGEMAAFLDEMVETSEVYRSGRAACHPAFIVAKSNEILMANVALGPWIHTASEVSHYGLALDGESLTLRGRVAELYEKRGNEYIVLDLAIFGKGERPVAGIRHSAIIRLGEKA